MAEKQESIESQGPATAGDSVFSTVTGWTRFIVFVPVLGLFAASLALTVYSAVDTVRAIAAIFHERPDLEELTVTFIKLADVYLLTIVLYIMSLGFYELFIDEKVALPHWLKITGLDDLKEKLIGVVAVVLAVLFLGRVIEATTAPLDLLWLGLSISAVILALGYFVGHVMSRKE